MTGNNGYDQIGIYSSQISRYNQFSPDVTQVFVARSRHDRIARNALVESQLKLVIPLAMKKRHRRVPLADLVQAGNIGLMRAAEKYGGYREATFETYAYRAVVNAINREIQKQSRTVYVPRHVYEIGNKLAGESITCTCTTISYPQECSTMD